MVIGPDFSREVKPQDYEEIDNLLNEAFNQSHAAGFVRQLREDGDIWFELAKPWGGVIAGYAAISRMRSPVGWGCLAVVAVLPKMQNASSAPVDVSRQHYSVGTRLAIEIAGIVEHPPAHRVKSGHWPMAMIVSGKSSFFERAGFSEKRARKLKPPNSSKCTLIAGLGEDIPEETLNYPPAFDGFGMY